jgi:hypothetical protein
LIAAIVSAVFDGAAVVSHAATVVAAVVSHTASIVAAVVSRATAVVAIAVVSAVVAAVVSVVRGHSAVFAVHRRRLLDDLDALVVPADHSGRAIQVVQAFRALYTVIQRVAVLGASAEFIIGIVLAGVQFFVAGVFGAAYVVLANDRRPGDAAGGGVAGLDPVAVQVVVALAVVGHVHAILGGLVAVVIGAVEAVVA